MSSRLGNRTLRVVAFLGVTLAAPLLLVAGTTWDGGGADDNWSTVLNWNPDGAPANDGTAGIVFAGSVRLAPYVDTAWDVLSLTFNNTAGAFSLSGSPLTLGGGGITNQDTDAQTILNAITLAAPQTWNAASGNLTLSGTIANGGHLLTIDGAKNTSLYDAITGSGGLTKTGTGVLTLYGTATDWYSGTTSVTGGTLSLRGATSWTSPFGVAGNATLSCDAGTHTFTGAATVTGAGTLGLTGAEVIFNGANVSVNTLNLSAGILRGTAHVTATGSLTWNGGTMAGTGATYVNAAIPFALAGSSTLGLARTINNGGTATMTGSYNLSADPGGSPPVLNNLVGATFDVRTNTGFVGTQPAVLNNAGLFKKTSSTGTTGINSNWTFNNTGTVDVQSGTLWVAGLFNNDGTVNVGTSAKMELSGGGASSGMFMLANTSANLRFSGGTHTVTGQVTGPGGVTFSSGIVTWDGPYAIGGFTSFSGSKVTFNDLFSCTGGMEFKGGTVAFNGPVSGLGAALNIQGAAVNFNSDPVTVASLALSSGSLGGSAKLTVQGTASWTGGIMTGTGTTEVAEGGSLTVSGGVLTLERTLSNRGVATLRTSSELGIIASGAGTPAINNAAGATLEIPISNYAVFSGTVPALFNNAGLFRQNIGSSYSMRVGDNWTLNNSGTMEFLGYSLYVSGPFNNSGEVQFSGSNYQYFTGPFNNGGTVTISGATLNLDGGGVSNGAMTVASSGILDFGGGTHLLSGPVGGNGKVTLTEGTVTFNGPVSDLLAVELVRGQANFNGSSAELGSLKLSGGTLGGTATVTVRGAAEGTYGSMTGAGTTEIAEGGTLTLNGTLNLERTLTNRGSATAHGYVTASGTGTPRLNNAEGATLEFTGYSSFGGPMPAVLNNAGLVRTAPGSYVSIDSNWAVNNSGQMELGGGSLYFYGPFNSTGSVTVLSGASLSLNGGSALSGALIISSEGALYFSGGTHLVTAPVTGNGSVRLGSGTITFDSPYAFAGTTGFDGATVDFNGPVTGLGSASAELRGTVNFNAGTVDIEGLTLIGNVGGSATLSVTRELVWRPGGTMRGAGQTDLAPGAKLRLLGPDLQSVSPLSVARTVNNRGAATMESGAFLTSIAGDMTPIINNLAGASFDVQSAAGFGGSTPGMFNNAGLFRISADQSSFSIGETWQLSNSGSLEVKSGTVTASGPFANTGTVSLWSDTTLVLSGGGTDSGAFVLASGSTLQFAGGEHVLGATASVKGAGTVLLTGGTVYAQSGDIFGELALNLAGGTLAATNQLSSQAPITGYGAIGGTGGFVNYALLTVRGGHLGLSNSGDNANDGTVDLSPGWQLRLTGGPMVNRREIRLNGGTVAGTALLSNATGGVISGGGSITAPFYNAGGTLRATGVTIGIPQPFDNAGILRLEQVAGLTGGEIVNTGIIQGDGSISNAIVNQGQIECTGGTLFLGGAVTNTATGSISAATGGKVVVATAASENKGAVSLDGGEVRFNQPFVNAKSGRIAGRGRYLFSGGLTNWGQMQFSGGVADVFGAISLVGGATGGKIINSGSGNLVTFYDDVTHNGAEIRTSAGNTTVFFGNVSGAGNFTGPGTVQFEGGYSPGGSPAAVGFEGDAALGSESSLLMELAGQERGTQYDALLVSGSLALDGALDVTLLGGYEPGPGDSFDLLDWGTLAGTFDSVSLPALGAGMAWDTKTLYDSGTITVVPEPATLTLLAMGGLVALRRRRRCSTLARN
jgi:fibronectin-binding autotransporter adhesin